MTNGDLETPTAGASPEPVSAELLRAIFAGHRIFGELPDAALETLAASAERVLAPAGAEILRRGSLPDAAFVIEHGRVRCDWNLGRPMLGELGRGEVFGLGSVIGRQPMEASAYALRDARLLRLPARAVAGALAAHPELLTAFSRWHRDVTLRSHGTGQAPSLPNAFAVLPLGADPAIASATAMLCRAFGRVAGSAVLVDAERAREVLGADFDFEHAPEALLDWCEAREAEGTSLIFAGDPSETAWTRWCLRQTDKIVVVAHAGDSVDLAALDRRFAERRLGGSPVQVSLLLVHAAGTELPSGTRRWLDLDCLRAHHHVRAGNDRGFDRAARRLSERAVGVVLGGGGARGFAHIGVLHALEEAGIAIDHVGGTSIGSIMAAAYARGWTPQEILELVAGVFKSSSAVIDVDLPLVAMLSGEKLDRVLRDLFGSLDISDLWLPFYAISSSLSQTRMVVHDRGPVWLALRASASLPGVFPPVLANGQLLVDGSVVNNVPLDVMAQRCGEGIVIAVDVGGGRSQEFQPGDQLVKGWDLLVNRLNPFRKKVRSPNIGQILVGSTLLSSKQYLAGLLESGRVDLFLKPPVDDFQLLGFDAYQRLYELGYETARKELENWEGLERARGG